jgi:hypothetical protein
VHRFDRLCRELPAKLRVVQRCTRTVGQRHRQRSMYAIDNPRTTAAPSGSEAAGYGAVDTSVRLQLRVHKRLHHRRPIDLHPKVALLLWCFWKSIQTALSAIGGAKGEAPGLEEYMNDRPCAAG